MPNGDYEQQGEGATRVVSGDCAAGDGPVTPGSPYVIRYSTDGTPGGIFHQRCEPLGAGWFALDDTGEAPDV